MASRWRSARLRMGAAKRRLLILLVAVLAVLIFAPSIVLHSPLRQRVLTSVVPPEQGSVAIDHLSVGWLTPLSASGVTLLDASGNRVATVERLSIDRTVIGFLADSRSLGTIRLENPTLFALVRPDGSNLEDLLNAKSSAGAGGAEDLASGSDGRGLTIEIVNGKVLSRNATTGETWLAEAVSATVHQPAHGPLRLEAAGMVRPGEGVAAVAGGTSAGRFELRWGADESGQMDGLRVVCQDLPIAALEPWLQRTDDSLQVTGTLTGEMSAAYPTEHYDSLSGDTTGRMAVSKFAITGSALAGEQLAVDETNLAWKCKASGGRISIDNLSLASDLAIFDMRGTLDERAVHAVANGKAKPHLLASHADVEAEGRLNLATLAQRLPELFKVREGTSITSGQVRFNARSTPQNGGHQLTASLTTTPIAGTTRGRAIEWDTPLDVNLVAKHLNNQWRFDRLTCQSKFLEVSGAGDARQMELTGRVDLDELTSRLDQFVDLTDWQLAGRGEMELTCNRDPIGKTLANGAGTLDDFVIAYRGEQIVTEPKLEWSADLVGNSPKQTLWPTQLTAAELTLVATGDELVLKLLQPTPLAATWAATEWPLSVTTQGRLDTWTRRLRPWVDLSKWQMGGQVELTARGRIQSHPLAVTIADSALLVDALQATTNDWRIDEPRVEWSGDLAWDSSTSTLVSRSGKLVSSTVAASFRDWYWTADPQQTGRVGGLAAVRMNLGRLARAQRPKPGKPREMVPLGEMSGQVKLAAQGGQVVAAVDLAGQNIQLQSPQPSLPGEQPAMKTIWQEPALRVVGTLSYSPEADRLNFDGLQTQASTVALAASGSIDRLSTDQAVNLAGTVDYDLASLSPVLSQYVGGGFSIAGREQARFEVKGTLANPTTTTQALAGPPTAAVPSVQFSPASASTQPASSWYARLLAPWQSAAFYGLPIGPGRLSAELDNGRVAIEPLDFAVAGGRLTASPAIELAPEPGRLTLPAGPVLTNIRITPDVSQQMLKYIAPVLAGATQTEGVFSLSLSGASVPLGNPQAADVAGQLGVQSIRVVPGQELGGLVNLVREIEALIKARDLLSGAQQQPLTLLSISDRTVDFRLVDGRVYHQGLEFQVGEWLIRSRGSVGLDETLSLMLELQVPQQGLGRKFQSLGITRLEVPVSGTLRRWNFDTRAVFKSLRQQAVGQLLNEETIGNALDKLFGGDR